MVATEPPPEAVAIFLKLLSLYDMGSVTVATLAEKAEVSTNPPWLGLITDRRIKNTVCRYLRIVIFPNLHYAKLGCRYYVCGGKNNVCVRESLHCKYGIGGR